MSTFQKQILGSIIGLGLFFLIGAALVAYSLMGAAGALPEGNSSSGQPSSGQASAASASSAGSATGATDAKVPAGADLDAAIAAINKGGCIACHTIPNVPGAVGQVGPNLSNIGRDAATRIDGYTAAEYIHESIADPTAFTAPECPFGPCTPGAMPQMPQLTEDDITAIVNYLVTLGTGASLNVEPGSPQPG